MKIILLCYHANIQKIYDPQWVEDYKQSILNQKFKNFEIYELCYNGEPERIFENSNYEYKQLPTFIHAMNYLIEKALKEGADVMINSNTDDIYAKEWLSTQLPLMSIYDIVTCNFSLFNNNGVYHEHHFDKLDLKFELNRNHNPVAHPAVCFSRKFLEVNRYDPDQFPKEDLELWKRAIDHFKFKIVKENLLLHRVHSNSVCQSLNR